MRPLTDLINSAEPAMPLVREWIAASNKQVEVLPCERAAGERSLLAMQVTTRSPLGAIAFETGGLLIDAGWLRVLGAGHERLPRSIDGWNAFPDGPHRLAGACLVADDAVGGFFAMNGGAFEGAKGNVFYLAPDTLRWEDTERGFTDWLHWALTGDLADYYENARWPGWEADVRALAGDRAFSIAPFLFLKGPPVGERSRRPVPIEELWGLYAIDLPRQLGP
jgi:hypothetical protein